MSNKQSRKVIQHYNSINIYKKLDNGGAKLTNIAYPEYPGDAATKQYVDDNIGNTGFTFGTGIQYTNGILSVSNDLSHVTKIGTLNSGTWNGNVISIPYGGTGVSSMLSNKLLAGNGISPIISLSQLEFDNNNFLINSKVNILNSTQSVNYTSGALVVNGGIGVNGDMYINGNVDNKYTNNITTNSIYINNSYGNIVNITNDNLISTNITNSNLLSQNVTSTNLLSSNVSFSNVRSIISSIGTVISTTVNNTAMFSSSASLLNSIITNGTIVNSSISSLLFISATGSNSRITNITSSNINCSNANISNISNTNITTNSIITSNISSGSGTISNINGVNVTISSLISNSGNINNISTVSLNTNNITSGSGVINNILSSNISTSTLQCSNSSIVNISASSIISNNFVSSSISVSNFTSTSIMSINISSGNGNISNINGINASISSLISNSGVITNISSSSLNTNNLTSGSGFINNILSSNITSSSIISSNASLINISNSNIITSNITSNSLSVDNITSNNIRVNSLSFMNSVNSTNVSSGSIQCNFIQSRNISTTNSTIPNIINSNLSCANLVNTSLAILGSSSSTNHTTGFLFAGTSTLQTITNTNMTSNSLNSINITTNNILIKNNIDIRRRLYIGYDFSDDLNTTNGNIFAIFPSVFTDLSSVNNDTIQFFASSSISPLTFSSLNSNITTNKITTLYIEGAPIQGANQTFNYSSALSIGYVDNHTDGNLAGQIMFERYDGNWFNSIYTENTTNKFIFANASLSGGGGIGLYTYTDTPVSISHINSSTNISPIEYISFTRNKSNFKSTVDATNMTTGSVVFDGGICVQKTIIADVISKNSGTFDIEHPNIPSKRLIHSFIEGPRCDLIYRGIKKLSNGKCIINLDKDCVMDEECEMSDGTFESLVTNVQIFLQNPVSFDRLKGNVCGNILEIICENSQSEDCINWMVIGERKDKFIKQWKNTNINGYLVTEYDT